MLKRSNIFLILLLISLFILPACSDDEKSTVVDGDTEVESEDETEKEEAGETEGEAEVEEESDMLPVGIPFKMNRPNVGEQPTDEEITAFTKKITGFWKETGYFNWIWWTSHGLDASYDKDMPDYKLFWQDTQAYKEGDTIRFSHTGGADNLMIRTSKILNQTISGYLMSGDKIFADITRQYLKGFVAQSLAMEYGNEDPVVKYLQARAIFTHDHEYTMEGGRKVKVEYGEMKKEIKEDWNAHTIPNPNNPHFGDIWIRTMRSKDDVPHMYRTIPLIMRLLESTDDEELKKAATLALEYMRGFAKDIVDNGYLIRTKNKEGEAIVPENEKGQIKDLASFASYDFAIPNGECNPKLISSFMSYGEPKEHDCERGFGDAYETMATGTHYFNYAIIRMFHIAAITNALINGYNDMAKELLDGLIERAENIENEVEKQAEHHEWDADEAVFLLAGAASGLPLTSKEVKIIHKKYSASVDHYKKWKLWDPWNADLEDGKFDYKPERSEYPDPNDTSKRITSVRHTELAYLMEYCFSPFRNEEGQKLADCEIVADPSKWGE